METLDSKIHSRSKNVGIGKWVTHRRICSTKRIRAGDPLSPLLFNLVVEVLSKMIDKSKQLGFFKGIQLNGSSKQITHLQFADDTIIFIEDNVVSIRTIRNILRCFYLLTGLKINFSKSSLYSVGKGCVLLSQGARFLTSLIGSWPITYLGVTIGLSPRRKVFWDPLVKKVEKKLAGWKCESLKMSGRLVLLKATMDSLPVYWFNTLSSLEVFVTV